MGDESKRGEGDTDAALPVFRMDEAVALLSRTPRLLDVWLRGLPPAWLAATEGEGTWSPVDVLGHLIHGERTDWMPRLRRALAEGERVPFDPYDRFAQFRESAGKSCAELLDELAALRAANVAALAGLGLAAADLDRRGTHPAFGAVTVRELLATWVAHDLDHLAQIARVLAHRCRDEVGPWRVYLRVISGQPG